MSIRLPGTKIWAFNPTYIVISGEGSKTDATVTVGTHSIKVSLFNGSANVLISRLVQLNFSNPKSIRSVSLPISVSVDGGGSANGSCTAIWGSIGYDDTVGDSIVVQRFLNFPHPTETSNNRASSITYHDRREKEGAYLRWIDNFGDTLYYLFDKGTKSLKSKMSSYMVEELTNIENTTYVNHERPLEVTTSVTHKICATSLNKETLKLVKTVVGSPIIDLYLGNNKWLPIKVIDGTYNFSEHHNAVLQDFEITIALPDKKSQQL